MRRQGLNAHSVLFFLTLFVSCLSYAQASLSDLCQEFTSECLIQKMALKGPSDPEDRYLLKVTLGKLTESQFKSLQARYSTVPTLNFDSNKIYSLTDFLPPFIQKTNGRVLVPHTLPAAPELVKALRDQGVSAAKNSYVDANCHSVTWQWINFLQGRGLSDAVLTLADGEQFNLETRVVARDIQAGDVLLVYGTGGFDQVDTVLHSAIYLGDGLVFEKPNPGKEYAFRLSYLKDVVEKYKKVDEKVEFQFFRIQANSKILPSLPEEFSLMTELAQKSHSVDLSALPQALLGQYILQETWDVQKGQSVFTLGRILPASQASPDKLLKVP